MSEEITNPVQQETELVTKSIKEFVKDNGFTTIANTVRKNRNGYPFITFINDDNEAENIYFSKKASEGLEEGQPVNKELFKDLYIAETENAEGEKRMKLCKGGGNRLAIDDLLS